MGIRALRAHVLPRLRHENAGVSSLDDAFKESHERWRHPIGARIEALLHDEALGDFVEARLVRLVPCHPQAVLCIASNNGF